MRPFPFIMATSKSSNSLSGGCLTLFGLPFLAAGLAITGIYFLGFTKWWEAQSWEKVPCWIESVELETSRNSKNKSSHQTKATYHYEYAGRSYQADRVSFGMGSDNIGNFQEEAYREISRYRMKQPAEAEQNANFKSQEPFRCYVNPDNPSEAVLYRTLRWQLQAFFAIFALTFPAVGAAVTFGGLLGMFKKESVLRDMHPGEPWKWKKCWMGPAIPDSAVGTGKALSLYTLWSALIIAPLILATAWSGSFQSNPWSWLLMVFAAIWCVPAWYTSKRLRQHFTVGKTRFEMKESPAWPGGMLQGHVLLEKPLPMRGSSEIQLVCVKRTTQGTGKNRSTSTEEIWSHRDMVPHDRMIRDLSGFRLPVAVTLPSDAPVSTPVGETSPLYMWRLKLKVPGTVIRSEFVVPVFHTGKTPVGIVRSAPSILETASGDLPALLAEQGIHAEFDRAGAPVSVVCPPARHAMGIILLVLFNLIWTGVAVILIKQQAPILFLIIWPVSAALLWLLIIWKLFYKRTVTCSRDGLTIVHQFGPVRREASITKSQITGFSHDTNSSSNNTSYYRVRLENTLGKKTTLADGITSSTTAEALSKRFDSWKKSG